MDNNANADEKVWVQIIKRERVFFLLTHLLKVLLLMPIRS